MLTASGEFTVHISSPSVSTPQNLELTTLAELVASDKHSLGWLVVLPVELLYSVFRLLDLRSLGYLSFASKEMSAAVLGYLQCAVGLNHIMPILSNGHRSNANPLEFREVGMFFSSILRILLLLLLLLLLYHAIFFVSSHI